MELTEAEFRAWRHRYYRLGKNRIEILELMGFSNQGLAWIQEQEKKAIYEIYVHGDIERFISLIESEEKRQEEAKNEDLLSNGSRSE